MYVEGYKTIRSYLFFYMKRFVSPNYMDLTMLKKTFCSKLVQKYQTILTIANPFTAVYAIWEKGAFIFFSNRKL